MKGRGNTRKLSFEEKKERVQHFRPIDDAFFEVLARDKGVCEEILRVILEDPELTVQKVYVQDSIRNLQEHVDNKKFPRLSDRVRLLKTSEGGIDSMCEVMENYAKEYAEEYFKEGIENMVLSALRKGKSPDSVADYFDIPLEKILEIQKKIL